MKNSFFSILTFFLLAGCDKSQTNNGEDFIGIWESSDAFKTKIEITKQIREGKIVENRFELKILNNNLNLPKYYIADGQYNYQLVTADPKYNFHPFQEFLHKNSLSDTIPFLGFKNNNKILVRRYRKGKGIPDLLFKKIE